MVAIISTEGMGTGAGIAGGASWLCVSTPTEKSMMTLTLIFIAVPRPRSRRARRRARRGSPSGAGTSIQPAIDQVAARLLRQKHEELRSEHDRARERRRSCRSICTPSRGSGNAHEPPVRDALDLDQGIRLRDSRKHPVGMRPVKDARADLRTVRAVLDHAPGVQRGGGRNRRPAGRLRRVLPRGHRALGSLDVGKQARRVEARVALRRLQAPGTAPRRPAPGPIRGRRDCARHRGRRTTRDRSRRRRCRRTPAPMSAASR